MYKNGKILKVSQLLLLIITSRYRFAQTSHPKDEHPSLAPPTITNNHYLFEKTPEPSLSFFPSFFRQTQRSSMQRCNY